VTEVLWDVRVLDVESGSATEHQAITIDGERIASVGDVEGTPPEGARDMGGATILPGLIDAHAHLLSDTTRSPGFGPPPPKHGDAPRPASLGHYILAATAERIVRSGFTTVRDVGSYDDEASILKLAVDTGVVPGPRILTCARIVSATSPGGDIFGSMYREADGPWEMRKAVREQIRRGADFIKFMATGARSVVLEDPEPAQMTLEEMRAIVEEAHRMGRRVAAHAEGLD
jgi:imidazolonepropionase-like amidohydrolase